VIAPLACVIPALDAEATLAPVVRGLRAALPGATIIAVDDGSRDGTRRLAAELCDHVVGFDENRGKGAALRAGFAEALARDAAAVLTIDADGQHDPAAAPALAAALDGADLVVGTRARSSTAMPIHRRISNAFSSAVISRCAGCALPDAQSGYRAIRAVVLRTVRPLGDRYEYETDLLIRAARAGFRIACVPVATIYGAPSHFREFRDAVRVLRTIWQHRGEAFR
jgi:glycosyltransferase involved in cell wall biosynthesis